MLLLPDLSEFQPGADMAAIKRLNGGAAIIRACYGAGHPDKAFKSLRAAAAGFPFLGIYMYLRADQDTSAQVRAFRSIVGSLAPHEAVMIDREEGTGDQLPVVTTALDMADAEFGLTSRPMAERSWLYADEAFAQEHGLTPVFDGPRHAWIAAYGNTEPSLPHILWQCTNGAAGIHVTDWPGAGRCDTNLYHGNLAQLAARQYVAP